MARLAAIAVLASLLALAGCGEESTTGPTTAEYEAERARVAAQAGKTRVAPKARQARGKAAGSNKPTTFASVAEDYAYESSGRRDPFQPYRIEVETSEEDSGGPLEQFELEQLSVVALVWDLGRARALVADPSGATYSVRVGSRMGKNEGRVIHIGDNLVLVKETYVDYAGEESTKDVELRIRRSQGG